MNARFDTVLREIADFRERMTKMEGSLDGFWAGLRDRDAAWSTTRRIRAGLLHHHFRILHAAQTAPRAGKAGDAEA